MDDMSLFANLSFLFLSTLNLYCIHILYFINLKKKKNNCDITKVKREEINLTIIELFIAHLITNILILKYKVIIAWSAKL